MPRKKQPDIADIVDDIVKIGHANGHDAEGFAEAEESGEIDEPIERPSERRKRQAQERAERAELAESADTAGGGSAFDRPRRKRRSVREASEQEGDKELLRLPLLPLRDMVIFPHMVTS